MYLYTFAYIPYIFRNIFLVTFPYRQMYWQDLKGHKKSNSTIIIFRSAFVIVLYEQHKGSFSVRKF